jgi:hypothetical protein
MMYFVGQTISMDLPLVSIMLKYPAMPNFNFIVHEKRVQKITMNRVLDIRHTVRTSYKNLGTNQ